MSGAVHPVRHEGPRFDVGLVPALPRSARGHPMTFRAGDCGEGRDFAARNADVFFCAQGTDFDDAAAFADGVRRRLRAGGHPEDDLRILPGRWRDRRLHHPALPHPRRPRRHRRPARAGIAGTRGLPHRVHRHHAPRTPRSARTTPPPVRAGPAAGGLGLGRVLVHMADRNPYT
ncbi:LLM class flavin-dependent oxidoreductase [Streptomyces olivaceoviridis]